MSNKYPGGIITSGAPAGYSVFFDGTGDSLNTASNAAFGFGTGDFTVEFWIYPVTSAASKSIYHGSVTNSFVINSDASGKFVVRQYGVADLFTSTTAMTANAWNHVAVSRSGTTISGWLNGSRSDGFTGTNSTSWATTAVYLGSADTGVNYITGYMSNVRVVKGTAVYDPTQTTIRVPTQLLAITNTSLLTCNSPAIVDQSSNNFTITANGNAAVSTFTPFTGTQLVPNPNTLANTQGVWSISDAAYWMSQNKWPMPPNYPLQSLRFNSADSAYLNRTPASAGNRKTNTFSCWMKKSEFSTNIVLLSAATTGGSTTDRFLLALSDGTYGQQLFVGQDIGGAFTYYRVTSAVQRDPSAFYHIVLAIDTTQATANDRIKIYINGVQQTAFAVTNNPSQNADLFLNNNIAHNLGRDAGAATRYFGGYLTDVYFIDGQALTPSSFGANDPNTGVWSPVPYSGTYGTNGFRLSFQDNTGTTATTLGRDYSGNGNNWTPNNFSVAAGSGNDSLTDGPTNWGIDYGNGGEVRGNYCTLNALQNGGLTLANGNLDASATSAAWRSVTGTLAQRTGKFYYEVTVTATTATNYMIVGVAKSSIVQSDLNDAPGALNANSWGIQFGSPSWKINNGYTALSSTYTYTTGDVLMVAVDVDAGRFWFGKNGTWIENGNPAGGANPIFTNLTGEIIPMVGVYASSNTGSANFGQRPFAYPAPSGFKVLCTTNLPIPTVGATSTTQADDYFNAVAYSGNSSTQTITTGFQPDLVWIKSRSTADVHTLQNVISGARYYLISNSTAAEATQPDSDGVSSFTSTGFSLGFTDSDAWNKTGNTYISWSWKAGGTGVSNTAGSITSTVSANQTAGFSVVTYTGNATAGATVGHGLGVAPRMIFVKSRSNTYNWCVYAKAANSGNGQNGGFYLNLTDAWSSDSGFWNNTTAGANTFTLGSGFAVNGSGATFVAYCFAEIAGFSKFGSYTGNGSTDGPFIYCGFRPRWIMWKKTNSSTNAPWVVVDTSRSPYNLAREYLLPNASDAEASVDLIDVVSNGFKWRGTAPGGNNSGDTYIFAAFAEAPFNYSRAR